MDIPTFDPPTATGKNSQSFAATSLSTEAILFDTTGMSNAAKLKAIRLPFCWTGTE
jgi:hypothetical protein